MTSGDGFFWIVTRDNLGLVVLELSIGYATLRTTDSDLKVRGTLVTFASIFRIVKYIRIVFY